ncbi:hypothetical protein [Herbiconiux sp.]|uniref:hypothetical protein n=1 Tax=Herbiconiux sp. TaxID=1871186 RepID=UPI0025C1AAF7|nr:hypothetical protein [Herbiconiux sp.]
MTAPPPFPDARLRRLPFPSWPIWLVFGLLLVPSLAMLGVLGFAKDAAADRLGLERDAVGRNVVLTGVLSEVETTSGLPKTSSLYEVTIPDTGTGAGTGGDADTGPEDQVTFRGDEQWGFPPSPDYLAELDFLVVLDDRPRAVQHGPVGSIRPVTEQSVREAEDELTSARAVWVAGIVVFWLFTLGLPVLAILLAVRRHRAKRRLAPRALL